MIKCNHVLFTKLTFNSEKEQKEFITYIEFKGVYLHQHIYELILQYSNSCSYKLLSGVIKYDKGIRNVLFKYMSALEESYRSKLFDRFDLTEPIKDLKKVKIENLNLTFKTVFDNSMLYDISFSHNFTFTKLRETLYKYEVINEEENNSLEEIIPLRNKVMHHNIIMTNSYKTISEVENELKNVEDFIMKVYKLLPCSAATQFEKAINRCNNIGTRENKANITILCLEVMKNGIFTKKRTAMVFR